MSRDRKPGIYYSFTYKEMFYFLFRKKHCPKCQSVMEKHKNYTITTKSSDLPTGHYGGYSESAFSTGGPVKAYKYFFTCNNCKSEYTLKELAYRKG